MVVTADVVPPVVKYIWLGGIAAIVAARWTNYHQKATQPIALALLIALVFYISLMITGAKLTAMHARAYLSDKDEGIQQVMANPLPARIFLRTGIAASETHYYRFVINWMRPKSIELIGDPIPIKETNQIIEAALSSPDVRGLQNWIRFPFYEVRPLDDGWEVFIRDLRYVHPEQEFATGVGLAVVELDEDLQVRGIRP